MSEWKGDEWRKLLINKELNDEECWIISDVKYSQKFKTFIVTHRIVGQEESDKNNEIMPIDDNSFIAGAEPLVRTPLCRNIVYQRRWRPPYKIWTTGLYFALQKQ